MPRKMHCETHDELRANPEAKRIARAIKDEPWAAPFLRCEDPTLRRLGSSLILQEMKVRLGMLVLDEEPRPLGRPRIERPAREPRAPLPMLEGEAHCSGCLQSKPKADFYRNAARPCGVQALCKVCFNSRYSNRNRAASSRA